MEKNKKTFDEHYDLLKEIGVIQKIAELENKNRQLQSLVDLSKGFIYQKTLEQIFSSIANVCFENFPISTVTVIYPSLSKRGAYQSFVYQGLDELKEYEEQLVFNKNSLLVKIVSKLQLATPYQKLKKRHEMLNEHDPLTMIDAEIIVPIRSKNFFAGFFIIGNQLSEKPFTLYEIQYLNLIASLSALAIENVRLKRVMVLDGKTFLYSYEYFMDKLNHEFKQAVRYNLIFSLIICHIDNITQISGVYGKTLTDKVIKHVASVLKSHTRKVDTVARYNRLQFAIIMPMTIGLSTINALERIRKKIAKQTLNFQQETIKISVSFGIVEYRDDNFNKSDELLTFAHTALDKAQEDGGNCIVLAN